MQVACALRSFATRRDPHPDAMQRHAGGHIHLHNLLVGHELKLVVPQQMRDQRLDLNLGEVDADTDAWPAAEANQRIGRFVLFARRGKAIRVEAIRVGEDRRDVVRASDRVEYMRNRSRG